MWIRYNPNPTGRTVGDCAVRAIAKALKIDWETAYELIAANGYRMGDMAMKEPTYSYAAEPEESYESETEFAAAVKDKTKAEMMPILDELMETLQLIHPRLYECTIRKFTKKY